ncbi:hypothetical protein EB796_019372 [Bugula neritina]|uniref:Medium-chain acyl-CoA ligase ACSF2, mitochondrial n=1 Tax=Bugula neritina TaxID=10212 RepID=A0A7J7J8I6_BUGNE|nr:hypothetical protein EB796_019372 [Bugula neritina]
MSCITFFHRSVFVKNFRQKPGSTGKPKCIVHQHKGMANALCLVSSNLGAVFALNYSFDDLIGYSSVSMLLAGKYKKVVLSPQIFEESGADEFGDRCSECLHPEGIEHFILPSGITQLIASSFERKHAEAPLLKLVLCSGQIISRRFKEYIIKTFSGLPLTKYGLSEVMVVAGTTLGTLPSDMEQMLDARIYPIPNLEVRLVDENDVVVDVGKDGEIQLKTFNVFKNYRGDPERTEAAFTKDGFFKTGDMGMMYPDGTFIIKGRAADAIRFKIFGDVVYPGPIEEVVSTYPGIKNVSVVGGASNDIIGDEITYCIMLHDGADKPKEDDLMTFCYKNGLDEQYKAARILYFDSFPMTGNGRKTSKRLLKQKVEAMVKEDCNVGVTDWFYDIQKNLHCNMQFESKLSIVKFVTVE